MEKIVVQGGDNRLVGSVTIEGAKNAVLPLLAATILASKGKTVLQNVPILSDVFTMNQVVRGLNAKVDFDEEAHVVEVDATGDITEEAKKADPNAKSNYETALEAAKTIKTEMKIIPVKTLQDAIDYLKNNP